MNSIPEAILTLIGELRLMLEQEREKNIILTEDNRKLKEILAREEPTDGK